jgi:hypothetical protein
MTVAGTLARDGTAHTGMREVGPGDGAHVNASRWIGRRGKRAGARRRAGYGLTASRPCRRSVMARIKDGNSVAGARARGPPAEEVGRPPGQRCSGGAGGGARQGGGGIGSGVAYVETAAAKIENGEGRRGGRDI